MELLGQPGEQHPFRRLARRTGRRKGAAGAAAELMTAPAVATTSGTTLAAAAELMEREQVRRLPVIDGLGRVVGIVTRGDLLKVFLRPDADIRHDVVHGVLRRVLAVEPAQVGVEVRDGVVTLTGRLDRRSSVEIAGRLAARVGGVVEVHNDLGYDFDDQDLPDARPWPSQPIGVA
ncbi:CBS domain-containing protein [Plantactinospora sp. B24E8]|uniref:BON domain-containing protein n=1 Tax=Plantactinospora sp. B24E8 TaxID=3153567 RepID=UPI00325C787B